MEDRIVSIPLMIRNDDILFVEDDNDTISENEPSTGVSLVVPSTNARVENLYTELPSKERDVDHLDIPKSPRPVSTASRSTSTASEDVVIAMLDHSPNSSRKQNHEYEEISVSSVASKKSGDRGGTEACSLLRRFVDPVEASTSRRTEHKGEEEETILEKLRQVVRKCTNPDPLKRPPSLEIFDLLSTFAEKS